MSTQSRFTRLSSRPRRWAITAVSALLLGSAALAGLSYADDAPGRGSRHGSMHGPMTPEMTAKHIDKMIEHVLPDGTAEQKTKVKSIATAAAADMKTLRDQHRAAHEQMVSLLSQPTIDRAAIEKVRASQVQNADQMSRRMTTALTDIAEVLTPAQRLKAAEHFKHRMEHMGPMGDGKH
jgi:Spy/CpxP family protein refolding chaperone